MNRPLLLVDNARTGAYERLVELDLVRAPLPSFSIDAP